MQVPRMSWAWRWLPQGILVAFIALQLIGVVAWDAETQRGTGFAMFATVDIAATRRVEVEIRREGRWSSHDPIALEELREGLLADPTRSRLRVLAEEALEEVNDADEVRIVVHGLTADGMLYRSAQVAVFRATR